ncbi:MAG: hypothetical protein IJN88_02020 [Clostridia bacterium]|nr:hypothetical protein [Clostridia bacterium]
MRKFFAVILSVLLFVFSLVPCAGAYESEREFFDDGSYIIISDELIGNDSSGDGYEGDDTIGAEGTPGSEDNGVTGFLERIVELIRKIIALLKRNKTAEKTKYVSYFSADGELLWTAVLTAEFSFNGKKSVCDSADAGCLIYDSDWKLLSKEIRKKDNSASAYFKIRQYKLGVPLKTIEKTITLTCDKDGNIK